MTPNFNLRHLRALGLIARHGSIGAVVDEIGLSQPAITQGVHKLERQFGIRLFDRLPRGLTPSAAGAPVLARIERAVALFTDEVRHAGVRNAGGRHRRGRRPETHLTAAHVRALLRLAGGDADPNAGRPAISILRTVTALERIVGVSLAEHRPGSLFLTEAGRTMARGFSLGVAELELALQEVVLQPPRVVVGAMALSRSMLIPVALAEVSLREPSVEIDVVDGSYGELVEALRSGGIDMIIGTLRSAPDADLRQQELLHDRIAVIGRGGHPLADSFPGPAELAQFPWIVGRRTSALLERWQRIFDQAGVPRPRAPIHCSSATTIRGLLTRSDFLTLLSRDQVQVELETGLLRVVDCALPETVRVVGAITRRDWFPTAAQERFLALLQEIAARRVDN